MSKILIVNGPNLNKLGVRDKSNYGTLTLDEINDKIRKEFDQVEFTFFQSDSEAEIVNAVNNTNKYDGIIINPGGLTHTSVAVRDALESVTIPKIEVHLSNLSSRENFRNTMLTTSRCTGYISGLKEISYLSAVYSLIKLLKAN